MSRLKKVLGTIAMVGGLMVTGGVTAQAATVQITADTTMTTEAAAPESSVSIQASPYCEAGYACMWGDRYYLTGGSSAARVRFYYYINRLSQFTYAGTTRNANNDVTSLYNAGSTTVAFHESECGRDTYPLYVSPGRGYQELNISVPTANDSISSAFFAGNDAYKCTA